MEETSKKGLAVKSAGHSQEAGGPDVCQWGSAKLDLDHQRRVLGGLGRQTTAS